jgi:multiple sugar transport system substrate-binding protein
MKDQMVSRRQALRIIGATAVAASGSLLSQSPRALAQTTAPAVRKKVKLTYWSDVDNPVHQKQTFNMVEMFNKAQSFITVEVDATAISTEIRNKIVMAYAAGSAPDVGIVQQYFVQDYYDQGMLYPVEDFFSKWEAKDDYFPYVLQKMRSKPGQPLLYMPTGILPVHLYYRADWFQEVKLSPPVTYDEFIGVAKKMSKPPDRYGFALRGGDYNGIQVTEPILASAGVKFVDESGKVDFDSPEAIAVTEKWMGMFTKDKSAQPTAVSDRYPQLFALMEGNKAAMMMYGLQAHAQLESALGSRLQMVPAPRVKDKQYTLANPEGPFILSSCKEKEAAWEFVTFLSSGQPARIQTQGRGYVPVRKSIAAEPIFQESRFFKLAISLASNWWSPPFHHKHWANFRDKAAPYFQQALRQEITPKDYHVWGARALRGEA